jgi:hypothetical protein
MQNGREEGETAMGAAPLRIPDDAGQPASVTLLELVRAISEVTEDDAEVVATVRHMLITGRIRLTGNFHDAPPREFD